MRPTLSQLNSWNLDGLSGTGTGAMINADDLDGCLDTCERAFGGVADWTGITRDAATVRVEQEFDHAREVRNILYRLADDAADAARELGHARDYVRSEVNSVVQQGFSVSDTGMVTHLDSEKLEEAEYLQSRIQSGLDEVERLDTSFGVKIAEIAQDLADIKEGQPDVTLPGGVRRDPDEVVHSLEGMSADERAALLRGMSAEDIRRLVVADPETMGNTNGVPFDARIAANEINVRNALAEEQQKANPDPDRVKKLEEMLAPINDPTKVDRRGADAASEGEGASTDDRRVDRQFVSFSPDGTGRMVEMYGAITPGIDGVGVYVPGTSTNLNGCGSNETAAWNLSQQSNSPVLLYMDGEFPQDVVTEAPLPGYAEEMAPRLVDFGHELDREVGQSAPGTPVTYVGHSYGGSIVGSAEQLGLRADRIFHASSAGTGVFEGGWNNPNPDVQRYSMTAPGDMIGTSQSVPSAINPHGGDPDEAPGVTRLDTGYYSKDGSHPGEVVFGPDGHGKYWDDPTSDAFKNIVGVIGGGEVTGYVERGVESNWIDVDIGDNGDGEFEGNDALDGWAFDQMGLDPFDNPQVTDNPERGPKIEVR